MKKSELFTFDRSKMDFELILVVGVFLALAVGALSLFFPKNDRIKIFYVAGAFVGLILSTVASIWIISKVIPEGSEWVGGLLGFLTYSILLYYFGTKLKNLADKPKDAASEQDD